MRTSAAMRPSSLWIRRYRICRRVCEHKCVLIARARKIPRTCANAPHHAALYLCVCSVLPSEWSYYGKKVLHNQPHESRRKNAHSHMQTFTLRQLHIPVNVIVLMINVDGKYGKRTTPTTHTTISISHVCVFLYRFPTNMCPVRSVFGFRVIVFGRSSSASSLLPTPIDTHRSNMARNLEFHLDFQYEPQ